MHPRYDSRRHGVPQRTCCRACAGRSATRVAARPLRRTFARSCRRKRFASLCEGRPSVADSEAGLVSRGGFAPADHRRQSGGGRGACRNAKSTALRERCPRVDPRAGGGARRAGTLLGDLRPRDAGRLDTRQPRFSPRTTGTADARARRRVPHQAWRCPPCDLVTAVVAWASVRECPLSGKRRHWPKAAASREIIRWG
jgi:hypothetical protein